jgi:hypothetical protein
MTAERVIQLRALLSNARLGLSQAKREHEQYVDRQTEKIIRWQRELEELENA